jgi:hypothetical protein
VSDGSNGCRAYGSLARRGVAASISGEAERTRKSDFPATEARTDDLGAEAPLS